ncbi:hypothetical protein UCRNP2_1971 [Neofusicoccum parvum UCRNP2]|uniref:Uncharacterized protein n=1 Tax=Botryosphaeria parva (strain UCR-NP2) TaxID=1287680 RepID=R1GSK6_BOTPV|nr:hypothetical protein UCRNP2_1971 [Neofusicoccum parvum UCRNP2]
MRPGAKLTEEELAERMSAIALKNASLTAAHARAEADQARFEKREAEAAAKAKVRAKQERQNRQQMMGERERNRLRKLNALQGREWDADKEEGFGGTGNERNSGRATRRGMHGGPAAAANGTAGADAGVGADKGAVAAAAGSQGGKDDTDRPEPPKRMESFGLSAVLGPQTGEKKSWADQIDE